MEDVLSVYARPHDPKRPLICLDEGTKQLLKEIQTPVLPAPGQVAHFDYEYERNGTASLFMLFAPLLAQRHVAVRERRTSIDYAHVIRSLSDELYSEAEMIILVQDNLNTHGPHSLYEAFPPEEARRLVERFEWHFTPKHGSWLNMAEIELSILARQCLQDRMFDLANLSRHIAAWQQHRNTYAATVNWHFTQQDARIKLKKLYPICS